MYGMSSCSMYGDTKKYKEQIKAYNNDSRNRRGKRLKSVEVGNLYNIYFTLLLFSSASMGSFAADSE
jgi:hypothetical protein